MDNLNSFWHCGKKLNLSIFVDFAHSSLAKRGDSVWQIHLYAARQLGMLLESCDRCCSKHLKERLYKRKT